MNRIKIWLSVFFHRNPRWLRKTLKRKNGKRMPPKWWEIIDADG